jgi:uncharacterized protein (TIGR02284 family)
MDAPVLDRLKSLHTGAIDARHGYEEALEDAEGHGLTPLFRDMIALHGQNAQELAALLAAAGQRPSDDGSFLSTVHRTIMSIRGLFGGLGQSVLPGLIDGEQRNVNAYDDALKLPAVPPNAQAVLQAARGRLQAALAKMQAARQAA